jgi:hypothetical protein
MYKWNNSETGRLPGLLVWMRKENSLVTFNHCILHRACYGFTGTEGDIV